MTNKENIISLIKTNPEIFPHLKEINNDIELVVSLYHEGIDLTKYLNDSIKRDNKIIDLSINMNPLNILNFEPNSLSTDKIFHAISNNNKVIQFLNLSSFKKNKVKNEIKNLHSFDYSAIKNDIFFTQDKDFMMNALDKSPLNIIYFKDSLNTEEYKELFLQMISKDYEVFKILNKEFIEEEDYLIEILKANPKTYTLFPNHKRELPNIKKYVYEDGIEKTFRYLPYNEQSEDIIYRYLNSVDNIEKGIVSVYKNDHPKLFKNKKLLLKIVLNDCIYFNEIDSLEWAKNSQIIEILHNNGNFFRKLNEQQKENFLFIKAATLNSRICCEEFFSVFNQYPKVIEFILEKNINIYDKIENSYKNNKKWIVSYLKSDPLEKIKNIPKDALEDEETLFLIAKNYPELLERMSTTFKKNKNNMFKLISENPSTFQYIDYSLRIDLEITTFAISKDIYNIKHIGVELYDEASIINNFFKRIILGESYDGSSFFILFFKEVMDDTLFRRALEVNGNLFQGLSAEFDKKEYLIAALKGGFQGHFNPMIPIDSELLYYLIKYHPDPLYITNEDFFLTEEDMIIKVLGENPELINRDFFKNYKINLSFAEKLISKNPESIVFIMDKYFLSEESKDMTLIDKVIIENPENFNLISTIFDKIENSYLLNRDTIANLLDYYIRNKTNKSFLDFLYKIPEILREDKIFKTKYNKIFGEKTNFINELLFKINIMKGNCNYPFVTERFEAMITEDREKEEESKKLENLFHLRNFVDKNYLIDSFLKSKIYKDISRKYYSNTKDLLTTIHGLKNKKGIQPKKDYITNNKILSYVESTEIVKEDFIEYLGIQYLLHLNFSEREIAKLYGYRIISKLNFFIHNHILKSKELLENTKDLNNFIISSIFIENYLNLKHNYFSNDFKSLLIDGKSYDIKSWRLYTTENDKTTSSLRSLLSKLFEKGKLNYSDITSFYGGDLSRTPKARDDLIYRHKEKIEKKISPDLESLLNFKITIINEGNKSKKFSLILEK